MCRCYVVRDSDSECVSFRDSSRKCFDCNHDVLRRYPINFNHFFDFACFGHEWDFRRREFVNVIQLTGAEIRFILDVKINNLSICVVFMVIWRSERIWDCWREASTHIFSIFKNRYFHEFEEIIVVFILLIVAEE